MDIIGVSDDSDGVSLATFYLSASIDKWWEELTRTRKPETFSWEDFVKAFYVLFFPRATRQEMADKFASLYQGRMSVANYYARFI